MLTYVLATLQDSNTILCANLHILYTEGLECLWHSSSSELYAIA